MQPKLSEAERRIEEARRTRAETLDLGDLALCELPASLEDLPNLRRLYLGLVKPTEAGDEWVIRNAPEFTDLTPLAGLAGLQSLSFDRTGVTDLSPLSGLTGLKRLSLSSTAVTDLTPLSGLVGIQSLDLSFTDVVDLSPLSGLAGLQWLNLNHCQDLRDLSPLSSLAGLQSLGIGGTRVRDLSPLSSLLELQILDLRGTFASDLSPLSSLSKLQNLNLYACRSARDLSPLSGLAGLQSLIVGESDRVDLSPLSGLRGLQSLDLMASAVRDLSSLSGLRELQSLDLRYCRSVRDLSPLSGLRGLLSLDLVSTDVRDLSPLSGLKGLQSLNLRYCEGVRDLSPLSDLIGLHSLDLYGCGTAIPKRLLRILADRLTELVADKAAGVPKEILSKNHEEDCLPRLRTYLAELTLGSVPENEVKVVLLGNSRAGKTQLCRRFRSEPFDKAVLSTHGVEIWRQELRLRAGNQGQVFQVNWWDFGGQDFYHGTHALFLRSRAIFLILWSPHLENRDEYEENGIPLRNQPLAYWLDYVRTLTGGESPVIVVQSQCDQLADRRPAPPRPEGFGFFECCPYSAKEDLGRDTLEAHLRNAIRYLLERTGALQIGRGRTKVRRRLYEWRTKDQKLKPEKRRHRTLTLEEFRSLCGKAGGIVSWEHALAYLHQTGVVFYDAGLFSDRIVLDQDWALDAVYSVFHRGKTVPWLRDWGRFTLEDLAATVWHNHSVEEQRLFLGLMKSCGVCFPCGKTPQGEERYVAPDLLPLFEACGGQVRVLDSWKETADTPAWRLEYPFFHPVVIRRLMSEIGEQAGELAEYWKYGFWLKDGRRGSQLLVQFVDTSTAEKPGSGVLELKAQGRDPLGLLREIRKAIREQWIGEKPTELLTMNGATVARSALANRLTDCVLDVHGKPVQAAAFAAFFADREDEPDVKIKINIDPQPPTPDDKRPEVFISYAWGDDTPEGKTRGEVVDRLCESLKKYGFRPIRDHNELRPGDLISAFIRRLSRADLVVAVISDKYLRSPYCMAEIHGLWQKSQEDGGLMAERLVPIVLPEVKIGRLQDRAPYIRDWKVQREELQELQRELGEDFSPESQREFRAVRNFAQDVDGILKFLQDVLMPRKLDAHLDDGFEAVREALRRRIGSS